MGKPENVLCTKQRTGEEGGNGGLTQTLPLGIKTSSTVTVAHDNIGAHFLFFIFLLAKCLPTQFLNYAENENTHTQNIK